MRTAILPLCVVVASLGCRGPAQSIAAPPAAAPAPAVAAPAAPAPASTPAAPTLVPGFGRHHHPIATSNPEAQQFFNQGIALVFGFNHEEAVRSFTRAAELDPKSPMPQWGIAWALGPNYNLDVDDQRASQANVAITKALELSKGGSEAERAYIEAMAIRFPNEEKPDRPALARRYAAAMGALSRRYPDDLDAATLYAESLMNLNAWKLWSLDGTPADSTTEIMAVLQSVLGRDPDHLGANHYYIHTVEASPTPALALTSAQRLDTLAPAAGHLTHMPAHIYARTGDHVASARANEAGANADREYFKTAGSEGFYAVAYFPHNLHFLADDEMMRGRFAAASAAAAEVFKLMVPHTKMMPMVESLITMKTSVLLRFGHHTEILAMEPPPGDHPVEVAWWRFARGVANARTGKAAEAASERTALLEATAKVPEEALFGGTGLDTATHILQLATAVLDARIAWAKGAKAESITLWRSAVEVADTVPYDEPPVFYYPVRESLGAALLLNGDAAGAEGVFRDDLARHPRNARSLFGLHEALMTQGRIADAAWVKRQFDMAWKDADTVLTLDAL